MHFDVINLLLAYIHAFKPVIWHYSNDLTKHNNLQLFYIIPISHNILQYNQPYQQVEIYQRVNLIMNHFQEFHQLFEQDYHNLIT